MTHPAPTLAESGYDFFRPEIPASLLATARQSVFAVNAAGTRCLLDEPIVHEIAVQLRAALAAAGVLPAEARAIQAIAFDKTPGANWKVTWHQDVMFPFATRVTSPGFDLPSEKEGIHYARPSRHVLEELLAVRLHLDDCDHANGPLRVAPQSHRQGILRSTEIPAMVAQCGEATCLAAAGEALLMRPLLLHASSPATSPRHRRVLHFVYHANKLPAESWHRAI